MKRTRFVRLALVAALAAVALPGCSGEASPSGGVGTVTEAISACNETVPTTRFIDGFPAYAQCATTQNSAIYSNDGINTATTSMGSDWVSTQYSGGYQCTELAHRYLYFKWHVTWLPRGDAGTWCDTPPTATSGVVQSMTPVHGDIMVFGPGSCGADATTGHVAVVDTVGAAGGKLSAVQQNVAARTSYAPSCAKCFLHVVANDGSTGTAGSAGAGGAMSVGSGGTPSGSGGVAAFGSGGVPAGGGVPVSPPPQGAGGAPVPSSGASSGGIPVAPAPTVGAPAAGGVPSALSPPHGGFGGGGAPALLPGQAGDPTTQGVTPASGDSPRVLCTVGGMGSRGGAGEMGIALLFLGLLHARRRGVPRARP